MSEVRAVVFDVGGVLLDWAPAHLYRRLIDDPAELEHFLTEVCPLSWHFQHDRGVPMGPSLEARAVAFPEHAELIAQWLPRYGDMVAGPVSGTAQVVDDLLAADVPVHGLTNMPAEVWPVLLDDWPELGRLQGVVVSGEEGAAKPEPAIFDVLVERFELDRAATVFVDDSPTNVEGARASGLQAIRFTSASELRSALADLGLPLR